MQFTGIGGMGLLAGQLAGTPGGRTVVVGAGAVVAGAVVAGAVVGAGAAVVGTADGGELVVGGEVGAFVGFDDVDGVGAGWVPGGVDGAVLPGDGVVVPVDGPSLGATFDAGWPAGPSLPVSAAPFVAAGPADLPLPVSVPGVLPGRFSSCVGSATAPCASVAAASMATSSDDGSAVVNTTTTSSMVWKRLTTIGSAFTV
jgi:hypothetical protein